MRVVELLGRSGDRLDALGSYRELLTIGGLSRRFLIEAVLEVRLP
jgi:hypothetical protein